MMYKKGDKVRIIARNLYSSIQYLRGTTTFVTKINGNHCRLNADDNYHLWSPRLLELVED